LPLLTVVLLEQ